MCVYEGRNMNEWINLIKKNSKKNSEIDKRKTRLSETVKSLHGAEKVIKAILL